MIQRTQEKAKSVRQKSGREKEKKEENVERQKQFKEVKWKSRKSSTRCETEGAQIHSAKQCLRMESSSFDQ